MSQDYTEDTYASGHVAATDLQNIENNFAALKSGFSGASSPSNPVAGMRWFDSTQLIPRLRDSGNAAWLAFLTGDASQKIWIYRNDSVEGWAIDAAIADVCLAVKGGSQAYNVNGGNLAGSWTVGGLTHAHTHTFSNSHNHKWFNFISSGNSQTYNSGGSAITLPQESQGGSGYLGVIVDNISGSSSALGDSFTSNASINVTSSAASSNDVLSDATWRARAAVGTIQYPDI